MGPPKPSQKQFHKDTDSHGGNFREGEIGERQVVILFLSIPMNCCKYCLFPTAVWGDLPSSLQTHPSRLARKQCPPWKCAAKDTIHPFRSTCFPSYTLVLNVPNKRSVCAVYKLEWGMGGLRTDPTITSSLPGPGIRLQVFIYVFFKKCIYCVLSWRSETTLGSQ